MNILSGAISAGSSLVGGFLNNKSGADAAQRNYDAQKEFAQHGIRWKVADAKAAGIHPLAALGVNNASFSPSFTAGDNGIAQAGQEIGRAIEAKSTRAERELEKAMQSETHAEQVRGLRLENDIRAEQLLQMKEQSLAAVRNASLPPAMPGLDNGIIKGQGDSKFMDKDIPKYGFARTPEGKREIVPGQDYAQLHEDKLGIEWLPFVESFFKDWAHGRALRRPIAGYRWSPEDQSYISEKEYQKKYGTRRWRPAAPGTMRGFR